MYLQVEDKLEMTLCYKNIFLFRLNLGFHQAIGSSRGYGGTPANLPLLTNSYSLTADWMIAASSTAPSYHLDLTKFLLTLGM